MFARPRVALRALIVFILATVVSTAPAHAQSWAESWFDNVTYTSPGSFEDQTRGYVTAGGMSGRVDVHNDYLMSVSLPKVRAGCGGIDMFLGGRSEEHTSELQSLMRISYAVFCLKKKKNK